MIITHETTIEQYEAWLATNPSMGAFKAAVQATFNLAYRALSRIGRLLKKAKKRSCLAGSRPNDPRTVYTLAYNKNAAFSQDEFNKWRAGISLELSKTRQHLQLLDMLDPLEYEIAIESLKADALEILINKN